MILAGDIGGTNTRLGLFSLDRARVTLRAGATYPSRKHASLDEIVARFVGAHAQPVEAACLAVAGPVQGDTVPTTNLAWLVDARRLRSILRTDAVSLINDLEAMPVQVILNDKAGLWGAARRALGQAGPTGSA